MLSLDPTHTQALKNRATAYDKTRDYAKALNDLSRLILLLPDAPAGYLSTGVRRMNTLASWTWR